VYKWETLNEHLKCYIDVCEPQSLPKLLIWQASRNNYLPVEYSNSTIHNLQCCLCGFKESENCNSRPIPRALTGALTYTHRSQRFNILSLFISVCYIALTLLTVWNTHLVCAAGVYKKLQARTSIIEGKSGYGKMMWNGGLWTGQRARFENVWFHFIQVETRHTLQHGDKVFDRHNYSYLQFNQNHYEPCG
jgi:hypothetical protein